MPVIIGEASAAIDTALVEEVLALVKSSMSLFGVFPLNILLIGSVVSLGFLIFRRARSAARP